MASKMLVGAAVLALSASACGGTHRGAGAHSTSTTAGAPATPTTTTTLAPTGSNSTVAPITGTTRPPRSATTVAGGGTQTVSATTAGLDVTMTVTPLRGPAGTSVAFSVTADASHAAGALGYQLSYGDGATDQNAVPQFCSSGAGAASEGAWSFTHRYAAAGTYTASVHVAINCSGVQVTTAPVHVAIS